MGAPNRVHVAITEALSSVATMDRGYLQRAVGASLGLPALTVGVEVNAMLRLSRGKHGHLRCMKGHTVLCTELLDMPHNHVAILGIL